MGVLIRGTSASPGRAQGRVRVIRGPGDLERFQEGEVLVARFTDPTMTVAMNRACAMVTDIGGLTSHTAIVSRELGVPCIVGTRNATDVLSDGQLVAVDGSTGEVASVEEESSNLDIDRLLDVFITGMTAMDPKTCLPFWDYDFGPIFGDLWIRKMLTGIQNAKARGLTPIQLKQLFPGPSVPRKELIYSLIDLKVGEVPKEQRLQFVEFWWDIVNAFAVTDPMASKVNRVHTPEEIERLCESTCWEPGLPEKGKACGRVITCLESLVYGLYSDIFPHNSAENYGPYDVSGHFGDGAILVIKRFSNLRPVELWPHTRDYRFDSLCIYSVYRDMDCTIDIYNHQTYSANTAERLLAYAVVMNGSEYQNSPAELRALTEYLEPISVEQYKRYRALGFEETKKMWVLQRNYLLKRFFEAVGLEWYDRDMLARVAGKELLKEPFWDFSHPLERVHKFYKNCFDPRLDTYYKEWNRLWDECVVKG